MGQAAGAGELVNQSADFLLSDSQSLGWRRHMEIAHVPIRDALGPVRKLLGQQGAMFVGIENNHGVSRF